MERFAVKKLLPRILKVTKIGSIIGKRIYYIGVGGSFEASHTKPAKIASPPLVAGFLSNYNKNFRHKFKSISVSSHKLRSQQIKSYYTGK